MSPQYGEHLYQNLSKSYQAWNGYNINRKDIQDITFTCGIDLLGGNSDLKRDTSSLYFEHLCQIILESMHVEVSALTRN